ncbi:diguanylate cyclase [Paraconexibacter antarcticus]|uniref:Diguanylate cyclase n=1 Tax=Paraconexibacter antarcticus TaxID=2949664 RepID=A0ABY5DLJ5_9ACTN|nr:diguanylate cyclase [Paraconexibacter antarcticus]UTI62705.1 diguanylate cyclase [Paraconexibacter antarcticus]
MRRRAATPDPELAFLREQLAAAQERVRSLERERLAAAGRDARTQLLTLEAFREAAARELERTRRSGNSVSLALIDIDGFRELNATRGAAGGDIALAVLADHLRDVTRTTDICGRTGADELAVLLPDTALDGAVSCAQRMVERVEDAEVDGVGPLTISAGAAQHVRGGTVEALLGRASFGLDRARRAGGGRVDAGLQTAGPGDDGEAPLHNPHTDVIEALAVTLLERDRYTGEHSESVVDMARSVGRSLGLHLPDVERLGTAALLHDIGKVAIPDHVLNKPARLDPEEWELMREHPVIGWRILQAIPGLGTVARIVRHEHESFDGSGYPDGLAGEAIPLGSRIILACDTYHAMTSDRPYRARMPHADAVHELARCAGTQFDPRVTEALIGHLHALRQSGSPLVA